MCRSLLLRSSTGDWKPERTSGLAWVTFVNRVNAPAHPDLPAGVALRFDRVDAIAACAIDHLVDRRLSALEIQR